MGVMKAVLAGEGEVRVQGLPVPRPGRGQVLIQVKAAALNHRDLRILRRKEPSRAVLGSDGAGVLAEVGEGVDLSARGLALGSEVVINPSLGWETEPDAPPPGFEILGVPSDGTFAEYVAVPAANVEPKPPGLSWEEAAAVPLAALTAYRALTTRAGVRAAETVVVTGIGGGVALFALQIARALGARVIATSRSEAKRERALALGAAAALPSDGPWDDEVRRLTGGRGAEVVVETVGPPTWHQSLAALRPGGRLVFFANTEGQSVELPVREVYWRQLSLLGTTMGNREEFRCMLELVRRGAIRPVVDSVFPLEEAPAAFARMAGAAQFGKIVLAVGS